MKNSLLLKLLGAFALVIAIGAVVISVMAAQATQNAFLVYTTRSGQLWAEQLAPVLGDYYSRASSWQGLDGFLQANLSQLPSPGMMNGVHAGQGQGRQNGLGSGMMAQMNQRIIVADPQGQIVYDSEDQATGKTMSASQRNASTEIDVNKQMIGIVLVGPADQTPAGSLANEFLGSVNRSILTAVILAGVLALLLGGLLFFQITSPLKQLIEATQAVTHGNLQHRVAIKSQDEFGKLGESFDQMTDSLARAETQRKHLMADVAHELRTPLAIMQANLEGMLDGVLPIEPEQVSSLHEQTLLLTRLVGDLRLLSLVESGDLKLERQPAELQAIIHRVVDPLLSQAAQRGIGIEMDIPENLPPVMVDMDRIAQVLNNLIVNALRYTPQHGKIIVSAEKTTGPAAFIQISVTDTGPGIDPAALPFVFDRFYRADQSRARTSGGSGLGLAIVKQLVEAQGGSVEASSPAFRDADNRGYGTQVSFTLPPIESIIPV